LVLRAKAAALRRAVAGLAPRRILDVGAGSGFFRAICWPRPPRNPPSASIPLCQRAHERVAGKLVLYRRDTGPTDCDLC
jgi:hypothetical protein